jgi:acyl carrier protein
MEEIRRLVARQLGVRKVGEDDRILEDLGAESLDVVNIIAAVEERYRVAIEEDELPDIRTVADLFECVRSRATE